MVVLVQNTPSTLTDEDVPYPHRPPNFHRPMARHWVQFLPWEFEIIPVAWVDALNANVTEVWAPSHFVRDGIVKSGLDPAKVCKCVCCITLQAGAVQYVRPQVVDRSVLSKWRSRLGAIQGAT